MLLPTPLDITCPLKKRLKQSKRSASILLITDRNVEVVSAVGTSKSPFPNVLDSDPEYVQKAIRNAGFELVALHFSGKIDIENDEGVDPTVVALKDYVTYALFSS